MKRTAYSLILAMLALCGACRPSGTATGGETDGDSIVGARFFALADRSGYTELTVFDPWHPGAILARYALADSGAAASVPDSLTRISVPVRRAVVFSPIYASALDELGQLSSIVGVADVAFFPEGDPVKAMAAAGRVADVGASMSPSTEKIIDLHPDVLLMSPLENKGVPAVERSGVPVLYMTDYMERHPLARAEWIRVIGALAGRREKADSIYQAVKDEYTRLSREALAAQTRPTVITERPYQGVWYMAGGNTYRAHLIADAGGVYPWAGEPSTLSGSLQLSEEAVIARGGGADCWLLNELSPLSPDALTEALPHARAFKAFPSGVYYCNTLATPLFRDIAFHPERVLADMTYIFHPELRAGRSLSYYTPLVK